MDELSEPPPPGTGEVIPFLGETVTYEEILKIVAQGSIVVNVNGTWIGRFKDNLHPIGADGRKPRSNKFRH